MANLPETPTYDAGVYQLETTDAVVGGVAGKSNASAINLANRTAYLKQHVDALEASLPFVVPAGSVIFVAKNSAPAGYLKANGALISRSTYADLFAAIGVAFGAGDGSTTFKLPDLRGEFLRGWDEGRGVDSGRTFGSLQYGSYVPGDNNVSDEIIYVHKYTDAGLGWEPFTPALASGTLRALTVTGSTPDPLPAAHGGMTRPRNIALLPCIKY